MKFAVPLVNKQIQMSKDTGKLSYKLKLEESRDVFINLYMSFKPVSLFVYQSELGLKLLRTSSNTEVSQQLDRSQHNCIILVAFPNQNIKFTKPLECHGAGFIMARRILYLRLIHFSMNTTTIITHALEKSQDHSSVFFQASIAPLKF